MTRPRDADEPGPRSMLYMNLISAGVMSASLVIGVGAAVTIFDAATEVDPGSVTVQSPIQLQDDRRDPDRRGPRFAPCEKAAKLIDGECVIDQVRTVTVPAQSGPQAAPPPADPRHHSLPGRTRVDGDDDLDEVVEPDDDYDDDHGTHTRTRSHATDTGTHTGTGTQTRTRTGR